MICSLRGKMRQKGTAMVEYAALLAFVCVVGSVYLSDSGIAGEVSNVIDSVVKVLGPVRNKDFLSTSQALKEAMNNNKVINNSDADKSFKDLVDSISLDDLLIEPKSWSFYDSTKASGGTGFYHMVYSTEDWSKYNAGDWVPMITACVSENNGREFAYRVGWAQLDENKQPKINQTNGGIQDNSGAYVKPNGTVDSATNANDYLNLRNYNYYIIDGGQTKANVEEIKANVISKYNDMLNGTIPKPDAV